MGYKIRRNDDVPAFYFEEEDTRKFLEILEYGTDNLRADIAKLLESVNYEKAEEQYLDLMLQEIGWIVDLELDITLKRKALKIAQDMYGKKGLHSGLIEAVQTLVGLTITIDNPADDAIIIEVRWRIPFNRIMGPEGLLLFTIHAPTTTTAAEEVMIEKIADFMKWAPSMYTIVKDL